MTEIREYEVPILAWVIMGIILILAGTHVLLSVEEIVNKLQYSCPSWFIKGPAFACLAIGALGLLRCLYDAIFKRKG